MQLFPHIIKYKFYIYIQFYLIKYKTNVIFYILNYANLNKIDLTDRAMVKENGIYTHTHTYIYIYIYIKLMLMILTQIKYIIIIYVVIN